MIFSDKPDSALLKELAKENPGLALAHLAYALAKLESKVEAKQKEFERALPGFTTELAVAELRAMELAGAAMPPELRKQVRLLNAHGEYVNALEKQVNGLMDVQAKLQDKIKRNEAIMQKINEIGLAVRGV